MATRVCIVGAGSAGMAAAYALSRHPDRFHVTVFDKQKDAGGMATSISIDSARYGADYINDGVQGCSPAFANTINMFHRLGYEPTEVGMQYVLLLSLSLQWNSVLMAKQNQFRKRGKFLEQCLPLYPYRKI
jgi:predicted NAD/FAD-binding protein